jgi:hypothetical protein
MRLRLAELEEIRRNPARLRELSGARGWSGGWSYRRALHFASYRYHRNGEDLPASLVYLQDLYSRLFKRSAALPGLESQLAAYAASYQGRGQAAIEVQITARIEVTRSLELSGEVARLDFGAGGGYDLWLFGGAPYEWRSELRMPLLQAYCANKMGVLPQRVRVGFYFFDSDEYDNECFSSELLDAARSEVAALFSEMES